MSPSQSLSSSRCPARSVSASALVGLLVAALAACSEPKPADGLLPPAATLATAPQGAINVPPDSAFYPYRCTGANAGDTAGDPVTGNRERDLVGDTFFPAFYRAADATDVFFRMRIDINPLKNNGVDLQVSSWDVLVDTDGNLNTYEFMLTADGNMAGTKVRWVRNSIQEPNNPRDPANDNPATDMLADFTPATDYYSVKLATDGSNFKGDPDYFVTVRIPKATLRMAGLNLNNSFVVWGGTNAQNYSLNADFGCYVGIPPNLDVAAPEPGPLDPAGTPDAINDTATTPEDTPVTTPVLANDIGLRDTPVSVAITMPPTSGSATVVDNTVRYTPVANFHGTVTYMYRVTDSDGQHDSAVVTVTVTPVNNPPTLVDDTVTVAEDSGATWMSVLSNDSSAPDTGETLTVTAVTQPPLGGTASLVGRGVRFTPAPDFNGTVTFTYSVSDGNGGTATARVIVTVTPVNDPPAGGADAFFVAANSGTTVLDVLANDSSAPDGFETLTVSAVTQPVSGGTVSVAPDGSGVQFTPSPGFSGAVSFTYTVVDGNGGSDVVTVTVSSINNPPDAVSDRVTVAEDSGATGVNVLANDSTPDVGETLSVTAVVPLSSGGTVTLSEGVVTFTPAPNFHGTVTFSYTISDGNGGFDTDTVTVTVTPVNDPPTAVADTSTVNENGGPTVIHVLANDSSAPDGPETLTVTAVTQPTQGGAVTLADEGVRFTPALEFHGTVTFTYTVSDGNGGSAAGTVTVRVIKRPTAVNDRLTVAEDSGPTAVNVLANDTTGEASETLVVASVTQPAQGGTVSLANGVVSFTPAPDFHGTVTFSYVLSGGSGPTATGTATVTVTPVNDPPGGVQDMFPVAANNGPTPLDVLANDSSAPDVGETLTVSAVSQPYNGGTVSIAPGGTGVVFIPAAGFSLPVSFTYTVSDGNGGFTPVTVDVNPGNTPASGVVHTVAEDSGPTVIELVESDTHMGQALTVTSVTQPAQGGTVSLVNRVVSFTPAPDFHGTVTFSYELSGGSGPTAIGTATVTVTPVNDPPSGVQDTFLVAANNGPTPLDVLANDSSAPDVGETLALLGVTQPAAGGTVTVSPDYSVVVFTPKPYFPDQVTFTYTVADGNGGTATVAVAVSVGAVDSDGDGLTDDREVGWGTHVSNADTDGDRLSDGLELGLTEPQGNDTGSSWFTPDADPSTTTDPLNPDSDGDGLEDGIEDANHDGRLDGPETDPNDPDTDQGGLNDGEEVSAGKKPRDSSDDMAVADRGCAATSTGALLPLVLLLVLPLLRRVRASGTYG